MNDDLFFNNNQNTDQNDTTSYNVTNTENNDTAQSVPTPEYVSQPYRYKYENGEKTESTRESYQNSASNSSQENYWQNSSYSTYNYNTSNYDHSAGSNAQAAVEPPKKKKPFLKAVKYAAKAACFGIIAGAAFLGVNYISGEVFGYQIFPMESSVSGNGSAIGTGKQLNITLGTTNTIEGVENPAESVVVQVVDENMAATVAVKSTFLNTYSYWGQQYQQESQGSGSGFIVGINETELLIATNNHVIDEATKIEITFIDDTVAEASIKGTDSIADLAIIAVPLESLSADTLSKIRVATLGDSDEVRLGEMAIAIGNALGYGQSVTVGYISAKDREVSVDGNTMVLLQTDAAINGGNSGGPLFNTRGEVIGINSVKYADTNVEGMCFAIPISRAIPILNELMNRETLAEEDRGFLGVSTRTVTDDIASFYGWPTGAYIVSVVEGSPAEAANLYIGDIVTSVNGVQIITADQLVSAISSYRYGTTIELKVQRNVNGKYEEITISATLAQKSEVMPEETETDAPQSNSKPSDNSGNNTPGNTRPGR